jgi:hypothetical protein
MSNNKRPFAPAFLQKLNHKLLRNNPQVWQTRTHWVLFFAVLFAAALAAFCFLVFFDARQYSNVGSWLTFTILIVLIGFVFWMIFLLRFNVFKRFGNWHLLDGLKNFVLYFLSIGAMIAVCFIPSAVETFRANQQFTNEEIVNDINEINAGICKVEFSNLPKQWTVRKYKIVDSGDVRLRNNNNYDAVVDDAEVAKDTIVSLPQSIDENEPVEPVGTLYYEHIDTAELSDKLAIADSVVKVNDTVYHFFESSNYKFADTYDADTYTPVKVLSSAQLYRANLMNYSKPNEAALQKRLYELKTKWAITNDETIYYDNYQDVGYDIKIKRRYNVNGINYGMLNAVNKKHDWIENWKVYWRVWYYVTLALTILVFIFRHTTLKTFFLSVLTAVVLSILTGLFIVLARGESEISLMSFLLLYYIVFAVIALTTFGAKVRSAVQGIAINLFLFATPFIPMLFVALNEAVRRKNRYDNSYYRQDPNDRQLYFLIAEVAGSLILLVLLEPLFKKLYRKWFAAPEN